MTATAAPITTAPSSIERGKQTRPAALITGAARRIGRTTAILLAQRGWDVAVHYRRSSAAAAVVAEAVEAEGRQAILLQGDLVATAQRARIIADAFAALPGLCALVNNASIFEHDRFGSMSEGDFQKHADANLVAPLFLTRAFVDAVPQDRAGSVVNLLDHKVCRLTPDYFTYTLSKVGLWAATRMLAMELGPRIRVNAVGPGLTLPSDGQTNDEFAALHRKTPLGRGPKAEEVAEAIHYLLDASMVTGQIILLDGGKHLLNPRTVADL